MKEILLQSYWRKLILPFLKHSGSWNCKADEADVTGTISSIDLHLLASKQRCFCTYVLDLLQVLREI